MTVLYVPDSLDSGAERRVDLEPRTVDVRLPEREFKLPWREAGPPNHHDDNVDSDQ